MAVIWGRLDWGMSRSREGHRTYNIKWLVKADALQDGPLGILAATGMPPVGTPWGFGNDADPWAFCTPEASVRPVLTREPGLWWTVDQEFTTVPTKRCQDASIENPLMEPPVIEGGFNKYLIAAVKDRHGNPIENSSKELFKGPETEFDEGRPVVSITMNSLVLDLGFLARTIDKVNDAELWGLEARMVKLSNARWQRLIYGSCTYFYRVTLDFDINFKTFDRTVYDAGTRVLQEGGDPDNELHYVVQKDENGELATIFLKDGKALPAGDPKEEITIEKYEEENFLLLGIPTVL